MDIIRVNARLSGFDLTGDEQLRFTDVMDAAPTRDGSYYVVAIYLDPNSGWSFVRGRAAYGSGAWTMPDPLGRSYQIRAWLNSDSILSDDELAAIPVDKASLF